MLYLVNIYVDDCLFDSFSDFFSNSEDAWYAGVKQYGIRNDSDAYVKVFQIENELSYF